MPASYKIRALNRLPFDFVDGLLINGVDVTNLNQYATPGGASTIGFTPVGNLIATNVQAAIAELENEKAAKTALAAGAGAVLVGYMPAGVGAVASTVQNKLRESVSVKDFGAVGDGVTDDTAAIQAAITSGAKAIVIPASCILATTGFMLTAGQVLYIDGKIKKLAGIGAVIGVSSGCQVIGGEIDGNSVNCQGIVGSNTSNVTVQGVYIHHLGKVGIGSYSVGSNSWRILYNRVTNCSEDGIVVEYTNDCLIHGNVVNTAQHGIRWWGGDSAVSNTLGIYGIRITDNICSDIALGGIWGSLGGNIVVANNHVENCGDVGIDFEGCKDFTCVGNVAYECANGCYAVFFGSAGGTFSGNTANNVTSNGSGFYATTNATYTNERLIITGNTFRVKGMAIHADESAGRSLSDSVISANHLLSSGGGSCVVLLENNKILIVDNHITTIGSSVGIQMQACLFCTVRGNQLFGFNDPSVSPGTSGGIWLYMQSFTEPCRHNVIEQNRIDSYNYSIVDVCAADVTKSDNLIQHNRVNTIYRTAGATYSGLIQNNTYLYTPTVPVAASTF